MSVSRPRAEKQIPGKGNDGPRSDGWPRWRLGAGVRQRVRASRGCGHDFVSRRHPEPGQNEIASIDVCLPLFGRVSLLVVFWYLLFDRSFSFCFPPLSGSQNPLVLFLPNTAVSCLKTHLSCLHPLNASLVFTPFVPDLPSCNTECFPHHKTVCGRGREWALRGHARSFGLPSAPPGPGEFNENGKADEGREGTLTTREPPRTPCSSTSMHHKIHPVPVRPVFFFFFPCKIHVRVPPPFPFLSQDLLPLPPPALLTL